MFNLTKETELIDPAKSYPRNIILKGRNKKDRTGEEYLKYGILGDLFEISSMYMLHCFFEALLEKPGNFDEFYGRQVEKVESFEKEFENLKKDKTYLRLVDFLQSNKNASIKAKEIDPPTNIENIAKCGHNCQSCPWARPNIGLGNLFWEI